MVHSATKTVQRLGDDLRPEKKQPRRRRGVTTLNLKWIADQVRKARRVQDQVEEGSYKIDSKKIARAILGHDKK